MGLEEFTNGKSKKSKGVHNKKEINSNIDKEENGNIRVNKEEPHISSNAKETRLILKKHDIDPYNDRADGYLYILEFIDNIGGKRYYVGSSMHIISRISRHIGKGGDFSPIIENKEKTKRLPKDKFEWTFTGLIFIDGIDKKDMSHEEFKKHKRHLEKMAFKACCRSVDGIVHGGV